MGKNPGKKRPVRTLGAAILAVSLAATIGTGSASARGVYEGFVLETAPPNRPGASARLEVGPKYYGSGDSIRAAGQTVSKQAASVSRQAANQKKQISKQAASQKKQVSRQAATVSKKAASQKKQVSRQAATVFKKAASQKKQVSKQAATVSKKAAEVSKTVSKAVRAAESGSRPFQIPGARAMAAGEEVLTTQDPVLSDPLLADTDDSVRELQVQPVSLSAASTEPQKAESGKLAKASALARKLLPWTAGVALVCAGLLMFRTFRDKDEDDTESAR